MTDKSPPCRARTMLFAPRKEPFFDSKSKCGPNCGQNLRPTRINTGVSADFRLQPQKPRFRTWVSGGLSRAPVLLRCVPAHYQVRYASDVKDPNRLAKRL